MKLRIELMKQWNQMLFTTDENILAKHDDPAIHIIEWIDEFVDSSEGTDLDLQLCMSATRMLSPQRSLITNFHRLHEMGRKLCPIHDRDFQVLFGGVTEDASVMDHEWTVLGGKPRLWQPHEK